MSKLSGRYKIITRPIGQGHTGVFIADPETGVTIGQILLFNGITKDEKMKVVGDLSALLEQSI